MQENLDLVIEGGWLIDGLGGPRRRADVGIRGERIAAIGDLSAMPAGASTPAARSSPPASSTPTATTT